MTRQRVVVLIALTVLCTGVPRRAESQEADTARFRVQIWGELSALFGTQIGAYASLRDELERGLPPLQVTDDAAAILARTRALGDRVRKARARAKPGDIFTSEVRAEFRKALKLHADTATCAALFDEEPGSIGLSINGTYPTHAPLSTMPPNVLAALPPLPADVEYRIAGRHLMLFDTRAGVLIDRMETKLDCRKDRDR